MCEGCAATRQQKVLLASPRQRELSVTPGNHVIEGSRLESIASLWVPGDEGDGRGAKKSGCKTDVEK